MTYTVADAVRELVERECVPRQSPLRNCYFWGAPSLGMIDAPDSYVCQAEQWAAELDRAAWLDGIRQRLQLVTIDGGMPPAPETLDLWPLGPQDPRQWVLMYATYWTPGHQDRQVGR